MKRSQAFRAAVAAAVMALSAASFPQTPGSVTGTVNDAATGKPLPGANVFLQGTVLGDVANANGVFRIQSVPPGVYSLAVSMLGYRSVYLDGIRVAPGEHVAVAVRMAEAPIVSNPVVVTASKHPEALAASHQSVEALDAGRLASRQTRKLEEALGALAGIHFNEENISIRGSSGYSVFNVGSRVMLMVDGVSVITSDLGGINWKALPLLDIERVEIVKGAGSALYGSSAMGGVVNLITKPPSPGLRIQFRTLAGAYDDPHYDVWKWTDRRLHYERADLSMSRSFGPVGLRVSASRLKSTGYMENNETDLSNLSGRADVRFRNGARLDLYLAWMKNREGGFIQWLSQNQPFVVPPFNKNDELAYTAWDFHVQFHLPLSARFGLKARASFLQTELANQLTAYQPSAFRPGQGPGAEVQADWIPNVLHHTTFGAEYRQDLSGSQYFGEQPDYQNPRVYRFKGYTLSPYVQHAWRARENATLTAGARWDRHVLVDESSEDRISPKIGLNVRPWEGGSVRATFGGGFRSATVFEKYIRADYSGFNVIPNPDLRSERSWFGDLGIAQNLTDDIRMELSVYQADYWDMIEPVINFLGTIQFQNFVRARIRGVEGTAEAWTWHRRIGVRAAVSWMDPRDIQRDEILPYRPKFIGNATAFLNLGPFSFQAEYRYAARVENVMINPLDPRVPVKLLFLRAEARWRKLTLQAAVNNALNYHYAQIERRMGEIRNAMVSLLVDIQ